MTTAHPSSDLHRLVLPDELRSPHAKLVYLYISVVGGATVEELQDHLGMKKITLFSLLSTLEERELVARDGSAYVPR